jgi:uncharacterized membrane protein
LLVLNALIAGILGWTGWIRLGIWTGIVAYVVMALLLLGEIAIRRRIRKTPAVS